MNIHEQILLWSNNIFSQSFDLLSCHTGKLPRQVNHRPQLERPMSWVSPMKSQFISKMELLICVPKPFPSVVFPPHCSGRVAQARNLDSCFFSHASTKPSAIPSYRPSKHLTTYLLHCDQPVWTTITCHLDLCSILSSASTLVSLLHPQTCFWATRTTARVTLLRLRETMFSHCLKSFHGSHPTLSKSHSLYHICKTWCDLPLLLLSSPFPFFSLVTLTLFL